MRLIDPPEAKDHIMMFLGAAKDIIFPPKDGSPEKPEDDTDQIEG